MRKEKSMRNRKSTRDERGGGGRAHVFLGAAYVDRNVAT